MDAAWELSGRHRLDPPLWGRAPDQRSFSRRHAAAPGGGWGKRSVIPTTGQDIVTEASASDIKASNIRGMDACVDKKLGLFIAVLDARGSG